MSRGPRAARWQKDGRWHITELYEPTLADRRQFPTSYPASDPGPFYIWAAESYLTEAEARIALAAQ